MLLLGRDLVKLLLLLGGDLVRVRRGALLRLFLLETPAVALVRNCLFLLGTPVVGLSLLLLGASVALGLSLVDDLSHGDGGHAGAAGDLRDVHDRGPVGGLGLRLAAAGRVVGRAVDHDEPARGRVVLVAVAVVVPVVVAGRGRRRLRRDGFRRLRLHFLFVFLLVFLGVRKLPVEVLEVRPAAVVVVLGVRELAGEDHRVPRRRPRRPGGGSSGRSAPGRAPSGSRRAAAFKGGAPDHDRPFELAERRGHLVQLLGLAGGAGGGGGLLAHVMPRSGYILIAFMTAYWGAVGRRGGL